MASPKLLLLRRFSRALKPPPPSIQRSCISSSSSSSVTVYIQQAFNYNRCPLLSIPSRSFCSRPSNLNDFSQGPTPIDYRYVLFLTFVFRFFSLNHLLEISPSISLLRKMKKIWSEKVLNRWVAYVCHCLFLFFWILMIGRIALREMLWRISSVTQKFYIVRVLCMRLLVLGLLMLCVILFLICFWKHWNPHIIHAHKWRKHFSMVFLTKITSLVEKWNKMNVS